ncbi:hypothetical protein [Streptomyces sp. S.PB5]|uniref:hypothetical protein n=1 Tax=Streptomyces sp. S.PB5 TaxID=3020844 RepID=UPI0025B209BC|nr:hypothetical protein [Streptomyces sp. S.PB5]MDN3027262.1 hypothetical protein [Streptomyces sp. S.PB5]
MRAAATTRPETPLADRCEPEPGGYDMPFSLELWTAQLFAAAAVVPLCTVPLGTPRPWLYVLEAH